MSMTPPNRTRNCSRLVGALQRWSIGGSLRFGRLRPAARFARVSAAVGALIRGLLAGVFLALACAASTATESPPSLDQYQRTSWDSKDGAPAGVWAIAQTSDGWLWFGGQTGLYRFDGVRFTRMALEPAGSTRSEHVSALFATDAGPLLIGRHNGGVSVFEAGQFRHYPDESKTAATVLAFALDADGVPWAGTRTGMVRFDGKSWRRASADWNLPEARFESLLLDRAGTLWVSTPTEVMQLTRGARRFEQDHIKVVGYGELIESPDGRAWIADIKGVRLLPGQLADGRYNPIANSHSSNANLFSRDSRFWSTYDWNNRLATVQKSVPGIPSLRGGPNTILEDRTGNIWIGTGGTFIHRLHRKVLIEVSTPGAAGMGGIGFAAGDDGIIWMASSIAGNAAAPTDGLFRYDGRVSERLADPPTATSIKRSAGGAIWVVGGKGLWRNTGSGFKQAVELPNGQTALTVRGFAVDASGTPWVSQLGVGLSQYRQGQWRRNADLPSLPDFEPTVLDHDAAGRLWLGYRDGRVMTVDHGVASVAGTAEQTRLGAVTALSLERRVVVGGDRGLSVLRDGAFVPLKAKGGLGFGIVTGIVQTPDGDVWVNCTPGLLRITTAQFDGPLVAGTLDVSAEVFDKVDGYPGTGTSTSSPLPSMSATPDGKIWLAGSGGIAWFDPKAIGTKFKQPRAVIEGVTADGRVNDAYTAVTVAKKARDLRFDYTALDYTHPERLQFRYRLNGYEKDWVEAGSRRQAFYTNLGPASYRFEVQAANETGLWGESAASVEFAIPPTFMQTRAFVLLCVAAGLFLLTLIYRLRVRQIKARERARLRERVNERERIARELHDTLLQSTQGLILSFQTQTQQIDAGNPARAALEQTIRRANEVMSEGRDRVQDLRIADEASRELSESLAEAGEQLAADHPVVFRAFVEGQVRELRSKAKNEAYRIGREALLNAFRHAQATTIEVQVVYGDKSLRVRISDDGHGIRPETLAAGVVPGHWGLRGMKERAREVGGSLDIGSRPGGGAAVELAIPAAEAYRQVRRRSRWLLRWRA